MLITNKNMISKEEVIVFLQTINSDFPIPLSEKVTFSTYIDKIWKVGTIIVDKDHDGLRGIITGYTNDSSAQKSYVSILGIKKSHRGQSLGSQLLDEFEKIAVSNGLKENYLHTHIVNQKAIIFYEKKGYQKISVEGHEVTMEKNL
ncbi:GNAT family N-acetyltransferase [Streptococcus sp. ZJ151]|uniref:GNAT family N-acetyltransferase n=1 Tax=Streptococcus jiangjianxini TaxID=3161189 RepID=UPI0032EF3EF2